MILLTEYEYYALINIDDCEDLPLLLWFKEVGYIHNDYRLTNDGKQAIEDYKEVNNALESRSNG